MSNLKRPDFWFAVALVSALMIGQARAAEEYESRTHFNVVFHTETTLQEVTWQALNVVDIMQTVDIAEHPKQWQEIGEVGFFTGPHPSKGGAIGTLVAFGVIHYAVTVGIENLYQQNHDYEVLQRIWQYSLIAPKAYTVWHNHEIGIKP